MTARLYYDAPLLAFDAVAIAHDGGDATRVILDRTAFYPTSGGQPHDTGLLGGARVMDVIEDEVTDRIIHVCGATVALGPVHGQVDAARRHDFTQQHTAQHLVSALAADRLGWATESVHFGAEHATIEFGTDTVPEAALRMLEGWSNAAVSEALPVTIGYEDAAASTGLRKPPVRDGTIRVVTIAGIDRSACGGTHTLTTAAIGPVLLRGTERIRGRVRVGFVAGDRALAHAAAREALLGEVARVMRCSVGELADLVPKRMAALQETTGALDTLRREVVGHRVAALVAATMPDAAGVRRVRHTVLPAESAWLRPMAQAASEVTGVYFVGSIDGGTALAVGAHADTGYDAGARIKAALASVGGRGGGSPQVAQGTVPDAATLPTLVAGLLAG